MKLSSVYRPTQTLTKAICIIFVLLGGHGIAKAQTVPVGSPALDEFYRRLQLNGELDSAISFTIRPLFNAALKEDRLYFPATHVTKDSLGDANNPMGTLRFANGKGLFQLLPLSWQSQFNSNHPYGMNDGGMIPAKGYQTMVSAGFFAKIGPLSIQLRPEFVYAANSDFESLGDNRSSSFLQGYYGSYNRIDAPERFGRGSYQQLSWGQSSIRLTAGPVSLGLSNENFWWGPGVHNSLMMGNNADGFKHFTLNTVRPIKTPVGSFEAQIFSGRLEESGYSPLLITKNNEGTNIWRRPRQDWRYLTGMNVNYQPKWLPGLFLGFTRTFAAYGDDVKTFSDYFPFLTPFQKNKTLETGLVEETYDRDQRTSLYARWLFTKARAEIYFEYALNDNSFDFRDFIGEPDHSRAYLFGFSKMVPLAGRKDEFIHVNAELLQLSQTIDGILVRGAGGFYYHGGVRQGYTHNGQSLGAGSGSGGNMQSLDLNWVKGLKKLGLGFERMEHDKDVFDANYRGSETGSRNWVDFAIAAQGTWDYKNFLFNAKLQGIKSLNYQWRQKDYTTETYYIPHNDAFNFHAELGVAFRF